MALSEPPAMPRITLEAVDHHRVHGNDRKAWLRLDCQLTFQGRSPLGRGDADQQVVAEHSGVPPSFQAISL
jgi:hypothetical protein